MKVLKRYFYVQIIYCGEYSEPSREFYEFGNKNDVIKKVKQFMRNLKCNRKYVMESLTNNCLSVASSIIVPECGYYEDNNNYIFISGYSVSSVEKQAFNKQGENVDEKRKNQVLAQQQSETRLRNEIDFYETIIEELLRKDIIRIITSSISVDDANKLVVPDYVSISKAGVSLMFSVIMKNGYIDAFLENVFDKENDNNFKCTCYKKSFEELSKLMHDLEDISKRVRVAVEEESVSNE